VARFDRAVLDLRSRTEAGDALADLADGVSALSALSTKGELAFCKGDLIVDYWRLHTIFREEKYCDESL
jgi:hypothetical protein